MYASWLAQARAAFICIYNVRSWRNVSWQYLHAQRPRFQGAKVALGMDSMGLQTATRPCGPLCDPQAALPATCSRRLRLLNSPCNNKKQPSSAL
jgi:hypothetical protein